MGKRFDPNSDVRSLLRGGFNQPGAGKKMAAVLKHIFGSGNLFERANRIEEIAVMAERLYWETGGAVKSDGREFLGKIAHELLARRQIEVFLELFARTYGDQAKAFTTQLIVAKRGNYSGAREWRIAGASYFVSEFYRYVGSDLDRSVTFALYLMEFLARKDQEDIQGITQLMRGNDLATSAAAAIYQSISQPALRIEDIPMRHWFDRMLDAFDRGNKAVDEVVDCLIGVFSIPTGDGKVAIPIGEETDANDLLGALLGFAAGTTPAIVPNRGIQLDVTQRRRLAAWAKRCTEESDRDRHAGERILVWFRENAEAVKETNRRKGREIVDSPRRGLRPRGHDHVEIALKPLQNAGIRSVAFHPEGFDFPDVGVSIVIRKDYPHLLVYGAKLEGFKLETPVGDEFFNPTHENEEELRLLLEFVVIDILHRIIVQTREPELREPPTSSASERKSGHVRPHLRRLPPGHIASEEARDKFEEEFGWASLPQGVTFVAGHYRNGGIVYNLPTEPVMVYREKDLHEAGVGP